MEGIDYYTATQAARVLELTGGRIRQLLLAGEIEGAIRDESGRRQIPQHVVHAMLKQRRSDEHQGVHRGKGVKRDSDTSAEAAAERRELQERLEGLQRQLGRLEGRLELEDVARSTLRESLERER